MLLDYIIQEKSSHIKGGLYHKMEMTYNSNRMEGSQLSEEQTRYIYEINTIGVDGNDSLNVDDIIETVNHFIAFDYRLIPLITLYLKNGLRRLINY